jgi:hypothetical protein
MIDPELAAKLEEISHKADLAYQAAEKVRKYIWWTGAITALLVILPALGLIFAIPSFINTYTAQLNSLSAP